MAVRLGVPEVARSPTLRFLVHLLTSVCTVDVNGEEPNGISHAGSVAHGIPCLTITRDVTESPLGAGPVLSPTRLTIRGNVASPANHPTVKPLDLMMWLIRLITPPRGLILDPFMGSGTTILAAHELNFPAIGIDKDEESCETAAKRLSQGVLDLTSPPLPQ